MRIRLQPGYRHSNTGGGSAKRVEKYNGTKGWGRRIGQQKEMGEKTGVGCRAEAWLERTAYPQFAIRERGVEGENSACLSSRLSFSPFFASSFVHQRHHNHHLLFHLKLFLFFSQRFFPLSTPSPLPLRNPFLHFKEGANDLVNTRAVALIPPDPLDSCSSSRGPVWILIVGINDPRDSNEISTHRRKFV